MIPATPDPAFSDWRYRAVMLSIVLAACGYLAFALLGDGRAVASAIARVGLMVLFIALLLSLVNYGLRFIRWQVYLFTLGHAVPWRPSLRIYLAGFALITTPAKAGEAVRGVILKRRGVPYPDTLAAVFSERIADLAGILPLTLLGLAMYPEARPLIYLGGGLAVLFILFLTRRRWLLSLQAALPAPARIQKWLGHFFEILLQAERCHRPRILSLAVILSLLGWAAEATAFFLILQAMDTGIPFILATFIFAVAILAGALTFTPGGLGSTEAAMAALLVWAGVSLPEAIAATLLIRITTLWFAVAIGTIAMASITLRRTPHEASGSR
jgi:uncharacterized protein (TIRG00374 family)